MLAAGEKEGSLSRDEVLGNTLLLLVAGHQTTINLIGNGILALLRHPDHWAQLQRDATRIRVPRRRSCATMPRSSAHHALRRRM